jgi:hypothetical protein
MKEPQPVREPVFGDQPSGPANYYTSLYVIPHHVKLPPLFSSIFNRDIWNLPDLRTLEAWVVLGQIAKSDFRFTYCIQIINAITQVSNQDLLTKSPTAFIRLC